MKKTIVINLYAGPGAGKSTMCANIFSELKWLGIDCEMSLEYAKDKVWEESERVLDNQIYVFGKQLHRLYRLNGKVDVVITDSPLLLSIMYDSSKDPIFKQLVLNKFNEYNNINFMVQREKAYNENGRMQTEEQAKELDAEIESILVDNGVTYKCIKGTKEMAKRIAEFIANQVAS